MASGRIHTASLLSSASLALMLAGCHVDLSGLNQLFSSDPTYLSLPGKRIGSGHFTDVRIVGTNASGAHIAAVDSTTSQAVVSIFPFTGGKGCSTGPLNGNWDTLAFGVRSDVPPFLGVQQQRAGAPTLFHFTTLDCKEPLAPVEARGFPFDATFDDPPGYLMLEVSGDVTFIEPWKGKRTVIAQQTRGARFSHDQLWSIEAGELVVRDLTLQEVARYGKNVTEFTVSDSLVRTAYVEGTCAEGASPCEGDLFLVTKVPGDPKKVDSNACGVVFPRRWGGQGVSYRSPCADGRLVVYGTKQSNGGGDASRIVVGDAVLGNPDVDFLQGKPYVFYAKAVDSKPGGTLMGGVLGETLETIGDHPTRDSSQGAPIVDRAGSLWRTTIEFDDKLKAGRLVSWKPGSEPTDIAANVTQISGSLAITDFDGSVGKLVQLSGTSVSPALARKVPRQKILTGNSGTALIANYDGEFGTLLVAPADTTDFEQVAKKVTVNELGNGIAFLQSLTAIAYLHDFDKESGTGVLGVRLIETGDTFDVGIRASEWLEAGWPEPGMLYVSPEGDAAGIWFARLR